MSDQKDVTSAKKPAMCPMVGWFDPRQLARTGVDVAISTILGREADYRLTESLLAPSDDDDISIWDDDPVDPLEEHDDIFDYSRGEELWLDYIADTGAGWDSTYTVAYHATRPGLDLEFKGPDGRDHTESTVRGQVLVFGGDQVYPVASRKSYRERLVEPYEAAMGHTEPPHPRVFAVPGNHDWYDSLVSFTRLFCLRRWFAGWKTRQRRSYFALKLPHNWWLVGTDVQLASDIDVPQVKFFRRIARKMNGGDRIIMCTPEPHWIYAGMYNQFDAEINENNLAFLDRKVFVNQQIAVYLSGDIHHYRRHEDKHRIQKIVAGGGGAHLFPTHGSDVSELANGFHLCDSSYPPEKESKKITYGNLLFLLYNLWFGSATAVLYLLTAWSVKARIGTFGIHQFGPALKSTLVTAMANPAAVFWILLVFGGFLLFTDTHSKLYRWLGGSVHGLTHLSCAFLIGWAASYFGVSDLGLPFGSFWQLLIAGLIILAAGWIVGSIVMGLYLLISLNVFHRHHDEAFSSMHIPDWKNFLRLHIKADGSLTIFPIGIQRVARKWKEAPPGTLPAYLPDDPKATGAQLIEPPITV